MPPAPPPPPSPTLAAAAASTSPRAAFASGACSGAAAPAAAAAPVSGSGASSGEGSGPGAGAGGGPAGTRAAGSACAACGAVAAHAAPHATPHAATRRSSRTSTASPAAAPAPGAALGAGPGAAPDMHPRLEAAPPEPARAQRVHVTRHEACRRVDGRDAHFVRHSALAEMGRRWGERDEEVAVWFGVACSESASPAPARLLWVAQAAANVPCEDCFVAARCDELACSLVAVIDGHGGPLSSRLVETCLARAVFASLVLLEGGARRDADEVGAALRRALVELDGRMCSRLLAHCREADTFPAPGAYNSGACVTLAVRFDGAPIAHVASLGDSRAVALHSAPPLRARAHAVKSARAVRPSPPLLTARAPAAAAPSSSSSSSSATATLSSASMRRSDARLRFFASALVTRDHTCECAAEAHAVRARSGDAHAVRMSGKPGDATLRVRGSLMVTRCLGDLYLKGFTREDVDETGSETDALSADSSASAPPSRELDSPDLVGTVSASASSASSASAPPSLGLADAEGAALPGGEAGAPPDSRAGSHPADLADPTDLTERTERADARESASKRPRDALEHGPDPSDGSAEDKSGRSRKRAAVARRDVPSEDRDAAAALLAQACPRVPHPEPRHDPSALASPQLVRSPFRGGSGPVYISNVPDVFSVDLRFCDGLVISTDGLFDFIQAEETALHVAEALRLEADPAAALATLALARAADAVSLPRHALTHRPGAANYSKTRTIHDDMTVAVWCFA